MGGYTSIMVGQVELSDEYTYPSKLKVSVDGDSLGMVTIKIGNSMTLRLEAESAGKLAELIIEGEILSGQLKKHAENQSEEA